MVTYKLIDKKTTYPSCSFDSLKEILQVKPHNRCCITLIGDK